MTIEAAELARGVGRRPRWTWLAGVGALAFCLRFWGMLHDLPFSFFGDELNWMKRTMAMGAGDLNPHWFNKPAFLMYVLLGVYGLYFVLGWLTGRFESAAEFGAHFLAEAGPFLFLGRLVVVLAGVGVVLMTYLLARRVFASEAAGLTAGAIAAVLPPMVASSVVIKSDVPCSVLMIGAVFAFFSARRPREGPLIVASLLAGIGMGTHYYAIVLVPAFVLVELFRAWSNREPWKRASLRLALVPLVFLLGFFVSAPYNFIDPTWQTSTIAGLKADFAGDGEVQFDPDSKVVYEPGPLAWAGAAVHFVHRALAWNTFGPILLPLAALGLAVSIIRRERRAYGLFVLILGGIYFLLAITVAAYHVQPRHLNALYPFAATLVWPATVALVPSSASPRRRRWFGAIVVGLIAIPALARTVSDNVTLNRQDSRVVAHAWIATHISPEAKLLVDDYGPILQPNAGAIERLEERLAEIPSWSLADSSRMRLALLGRYPPKTRFDIEELGHQWWLPSEVTNEELRGSERHRRMGNPLTDRVPRTLEDYRCSGFDYIITNSQAQAIYFDGRLPRGSFPSFERFYAELEALEPVKIFDPAGWGGKGPVIRIYDISLPSEELRELCSAA